MARIPYSKFQNLRSGQTVWRVWGHMRKDGTLDINAMQTPIIGKKILFKLSGDYYAPMMVWKRFEKTDVMHRGTWMYSVARFLNDLDGIACFDTKRSADRFVKEVKEGLHPKVVKDMRRRMEYDLIWEEMDDFFDEDRKELLFSDESLEELISTCITGDSPYTPLDELWNASLGHGA